MSFKNYFNWKIDVQKKDKEKVMIKEVISNDNDISETFNKFFCKYNSKYENNPQ